MALLLERKKKRKTRRRVTDACGGGCCGGIAMGPRDDALQHFLVPTFVADHDSQVVTEV